MTPLVCTPITFRDRRSLPVRRSPRKLYIQNEFGTATELSDLQMQAFGGLRKPEETTCIQIGVRPLRTVLLSAGCKPINICCAKGEDRYLQDSAIG